MVRVRVGVRIGVRVRVRVKVRVRLPTQEDKMGRCKTKFSSTP